MRLLGEKQVLESSERHLQELLQRLEEELSALQKEKAGEALEQHSQVGEPPLLPRSHHRRLIRPRTKRPFKGTSAVYPEGLAASFTTDPGRPVTSSVPSCEDK